MLLDLPDLAFHHIAGMLTAKDTALLLVAAPHVRQRLPQDAVQLKLDEERREALEDVATRTIWMLDQLLHGVDGDVVQEELEQLDGAVYYACTVGEFRVCGSRGPLDVPFPAATEPQAKRWARCYTRIRGQPELCWTVSLEQGKVRGRHVVRAFVRALAVRALFPLEFETYFDYYPEVLKFEMLWHVGAGLELEPQGYHRDIDSVCAIEIAGVFASAFPDSVP